MILTALKQYYNRLKGNPEKNIPEFGFSREKVDFAIILDKNGKYVDTHDIRDTSGKKPRSREELLPQPPKRTAGVKSNFMWDNTGYVLGIDAKGKPERVAKMFEAFKELHHEIGDNLDDEAMKSLLNFLDNWNPEKAPELKFWDEMIGKNVVFRFDGEKEYFHQRRAIKKAWKKHIHGKEVKYKSRCLITGEHTSIERLHPAIKGVRGAQSTGASIISFNLDSFCSYGKTQSYNAPVSVEASFEYTTALNYLLRRESEQKIQIGDATTVFWAEKSSPLEGLLAQIFNPQEEDTSTVKDIRDYLENVRDGRKLPETFEPDAKFYILGLSPNASRLSVRFWYAGTVGEFSERIGMHFRDIAIEKGHPKDIEFPGMWLLLIQTAVQGKTQNIPPLLGGELMRSILTGGNYPESMLSALIGRIRAGEEINYLRASLIKGILTRNHKMEVTMSWDPNNKDRAYLLGGLFAILEKTQKDAGNETIREKYFRSASATPKIAFSVLMPLAQHHISKAEFGIQDDKLMAKVMEDVKEFPAYMNLQEQGLFSIGYYHMRNKIWKDIMDASEAKKAKSNQ